jgi:hypothetical protein
MSVFNLLIIPLFLFRLLKINFLKKCISILLAFLIFLNSAGYIILFWQIQQDVKREMIKKISEILPSEELTCIKFLKKKIPRSEWIEKNEFEYNGSMYDVVKKEETSKYYLFYCLNDEKEEILIKNYSRQFDDNKEKPTQHSTRTLIALVAPAIVKNKTLIKRIDTVSSINNYLSFNYQSIWLDKLTPPPKQTV